MVTVVKSLKDSVQFLNGGRGQGNDTSKMNLQCVAQALIVKRRIGTSVFSNMVGGQKRPTGVKALDRARHPVPTIVGPGSSIQRISNM